jgi:hypothetical protein
VSNFFIGDVPRCTRPTCVRNNSARLRCTRYYVIVSSLPGIAQEATKITSYMFLLCISTGCDVTLDPTTMDPQDLCGILSNPLRIGPTLQSQPFVTGGTTESDTGFPWVVNISANLACHGTLIGPKWVLTAAHCLDTAPGGVRVTYSRNNDTATSAQQDTGPGSICVHPQWDPSRPLNGYDIGLVHLATTWQDKPFLVPAYLPWESALPGSPGTLASGAQISGTISVLRGAILPSDKCLLGNHEFCAMSMTAGLCEGDSGSGFINNDANPMSNSCPIVTGIAVRSDLVNGTSCSVPSHPFAATDVFQYLDWIKSETGIIPPPGHCQSSS